MTKKEEIVPEPKKEPVKEMELIPPAPTKPELEKKEQSVMLTEADVQQIVKTTLSDLNKVVAPNDTLQKPPEPKQLGWLEEMGTWK